MGTVPLRGSLRQGTVPLRGSLRQGTVPFFLIFFLIIASNISFASTVPSKKLYVGERLVYSVRLLGIELGKGTAEIREITTLRGRAAYHIVVEVRSAPVLDLIYKVRDTHHSYIDVEKLHSLRYEKILSEGRYHADEVMEYDQENHKATYHSRLNGSRKEMLIPPDVQDQLSCGYWFRLQDIEPGTESNVPVNADEKNWDLRVKVLKKAKIKLDGFDEREAVEVAPEIEFQGIFVKRGKIRGWMGLDERRVPLKMKVKIPVLGSINAQLVDYRPGDNKGLQNKLEND